MHTLLATTGASPQVVTETLYAIHHSNGQWPDEIYIITTSFGKDKAVKGLLEQGHLQRLCQQLNRPQPAFSADHILETPGADGAAVEDARSLADHEALANFIMTQVRDRTRSPADSLHASLAGGRKTMTFYLGYAMSLFGRAQDSLSHVLVSDGYESVPSFWFPTAEEGHRHIETRTATLDANAAQVTLAPIPFVRHRRDLPPVLLQERDAVNFAQLVQLINLGENPQLLRVCVDLPNKCIKLHAADSDLCLTFELGLLELAFYTLMARSTVEHETDLNRPSSTKKDRGIALSLLEELMPICNLSSENQIDKNLEKLSNTDGDNQAQLSTRTLDSLKNGMSDTWFDSRKNKISALFAQQLPISLVRWITPSAIWEKNGTPLIQDHTERTPQGCGYGIALQPEQISIVDIG